MDVSLLCLGSVACVCCVAPTLCCVRRRLISGQIVPGQYSSTRRGFIWEDGDRGREEEEGGNKEEERVRGLGSLTFIWAVT